MDQIASYIILVLWQKYLEVIDNTLLVQRSRQMYIRLKTVY